MPLLTHLTQTPHSGSRSDLIAEKYVEHPVILIKTQVALAARLRHALEAIMILLPLVPESWFRHTLEGSAKMIGSLSLKQHDLITDLQRKLIIFFK